MALSVTIDVERSLIVTRASGVLTFDDVLAARAETRSHPDFDPRYFDLFDLREVTEIEISGAEMARIAATSVLARGVCRAFVVKTQVQYGMARMFSGLAEPHDQNVFVFRDLAVAEAWLESRRRELFRP
jgi:hypothetical protein